MAPKSPTYFGGPPEILEILQKVLPSEKYNLNMEVVHDVAEDCDVIYLRVREKGREGHVKMFREPVEDFPSDLFITQLMLRYG